MSSTSKSKDQYDNMGTAASIVSSMNGPRGDDIWAWGGGSVQFLRGFLRRNITVPTRHVSARGASRRDLLRSEGRPRENRAYFVSTDL